MTNTYTKEQIKTGNYNVVEVFGYVAVNPLPFRLVGFSETSVDGMYEASGYCGETLDEVIGTRNRGWCDLILGIYQLNTDGRSWNLIPNSWDRNAKIRPLQPLAVAAER